MATQQQPKTVATPAGPVAIPATKDQDKAFQPGQGAQHPDNPHVVVGTD